MKRVLTIILAGGIITLAIQLDIFARGGGGGGRGGHRGSADPSDDGELLLLDQDAPHGKMLTRSPVPLERRDDLPAANIITKTVNAAVTATSTVVITAPAATVTEDAFAQATKVV